MVEHLLRYDQVDISYRGELAVKQVSFAVDPGEILGIVGESGWSPGAISGIREKISQIYQGETAGD